MKRTLAALSVSGLALGMFAPCATAQSASPDEVRAIVSEMMSDAQNRSSLLQSSPISGHDGGFYLGNASGDFRLDIAGQVQFRYTANFSDGGNPTNGTDDYTGGFSNQRTRLDISGQIGDPGLIYRVHGEFASNGGQFSLLDAYVGYALDDNFTLIWGQLKAPLQREELVASKYQLAADRSFANNLFSAQRTQGIALQYQDDNLRATFAFSDGANAINTDFNQDQQNFAAIPTPAPIGGEADYAFTLRTEWKLAGEWDRFVDFTSMPGEEYAAMIGAAGHIESNETLNPVGVAGGPADVLFAGYTADVSLEGDGWNFFASFFGFSSDYEGLLDLDGDATPDDLSFTDLGVVVQGGVFIPDTDVEVFARYDGIFVDEDRAGDDTFNTVTFGMNWYWAGHAAKFTLDAQIFLDEGVGADGVPLAAAASGLNTNKSYVADDDDGQVAVRAQFQLLF